MTATAGLANMAAVDGRSGIAGWQNRVFAVTIGTDRGLRNAMFYGLAMHTASIFLSDIGVASTADFRDGRAKLSSSCALDFMRYPVTSGTVRCSAVAITGGLSMHTAGIVLDYIAVT
jgi:hypothetical protein